MNQVLFILITISFQYYYYVSSQLIRQYSLAIVFDTTGSMSDEWSSVKSGIKTIVGKHITNNRRKIDELLVVPFNDPDAGPVLRFENEHSFYEHIDSMSVHDGDDCPEMGLTGILYALGNSSYESFIYVFTDADAKDFELQDKILKLLLRKQAQINVIMTDSCSTSTSPGFLAYKRIAEESSGMLYRISKVEANNIMFIVNEAVEEDKVNILKFEASKPGSQRYSFAVDSSIPELTIQITIPTMHESFKVTVIDPKGAIMRQDRELKQIFKSSTSTYMVVLKNPMPGNWKLIVDTESEQHTVLVSGKSEMKVEIKFGPLLRSNKTFGRPVKGFENYVFVDTTSGDQRVDNVEITDRTTRNTTTLRMKRLELTETTYVSLKKIPIAGNSSYEIRIRGEDKNGTSFQRVSDSALIPQQLEKKEQQSLEIEVEKELAMMSKITSRREPQITTGTAIGISLVIICAILIVASSVIYVVRFRKEYDDSPETINNNIYGCNSSYDDVVDEIKSLKFVLDDDF